MISNIYFYLMSIAGIVLICVTIAALITIPRSARKRHKVLYIIAGITILCEAILIAEIFIKIFTAVHEAGIM